MAGAAGLGMAGLGRAGLERRGGVGMVWCGPARLVVGR